MTSSFPILAGHEIENLLKFHGSDGYPLSEGPGENVVGRSDGIVFHHLHLLL